MSIVSRYRTTRDWVIRNEHHLSTIVFFGGFVIDNLTLTRIDLWFDNAILLSYLVISGISILVINTVRERAERLEQKRLSKRIHTVAMLAMHFALGGVFSAFIIFYTRSADILTSWPLLLLILIVMVANEFFKKPYQETVFQISIYFLAIFLYTIFSIPILLKHVGALIFVASSFVSLLLIRLFLRCLRWFAPDSMYRSRAPLLFAIGAIFIVMQVLYFTNILPPIPLSLKSGNVYHFVARQTDGSYVVERETYPWYALVSRVKHDVHLVSGAPLYFFSAVFAPERLETSVVHRWEQYDAMTDSWIVKETIAFPIVGGRPDGFRGYSSYTPLSAGSYRVSVVTLRGQMLGGESFRVHMSELPPETKTDVIK